MGLIRHAGFSVCLYRAIGRDGGREKGESFSREQRTSHMVGWRAGAIIVLACNVRSVGGQEPVSFFVSERACLVETSVRRVMSMTLLRCSCCTHKSSPGTTRASHRYIRACAAEPHHQPAIDWTTWCEFQYLCSRTSICSSVCYMFEGVHTVNISRIYTAARGSCPLSLSHSILFGVLGLSLHTEGRSQIFPFLL